MSNHTIPQTVCGVIPAFIHARIARNRGVEARAHARATLEHMRQLAAGGGRTLLDSPDDSLHGSPHDGLPHDRQRVYDAGHEHGLPGRQVLPGAQYGGGDVEVTEAWDGSGAVLAFFQSVFHRNSIDGKGMRIDSTVHYGPGFENAMWNGRQMVYGDGDGFVFNGFTRSVEVIAHELAHGLTQYTAALGYSGQTGALNEHLSDAIGIMVRQWLLKQTAEESEWLIGEELFGPGVTPGSAVRCLAFPGNAFHDPILGTDPQPLHMDDYVHTDADHGGVHINSGILNHAFFLAAMEIGGETWKVLAPLWYAVLTGQLTADAGFDDFAKAVVETAGEWFGFGSRVQDAVANAFADVGLPQSGLLAVPSRARAEARRAEYVAAAAARRRRPWHRDYAGRALSILNHLEQERKKSS